MFLNDGVPQGCVLGLILFCLVVYISSLLTSLSSSLGYEQELSYQRLDGSFSAFGDHDAAGSTWYIVNLCTFKTNMYRKPQKP